MASWNGSVSPIQNAGHRQRHDGERQCSLLVKMTLLHLWSGFWNYCSCSGVFSLYIFFLIFNLQHQGLCLKRCLSCLHSQIFSDSQVIAQILASPCFWHLKLLCSPTHSTAYPPFLDSLSHFCSCFSPIALFSVTEVSNMVFIFVTVPLITASYHSHKMWEGEEYNLCFCSFVFLEPWEGLKENINLSGGGRVHVLHTKYIPRW